jgi:hypothetical protein
MAILVALAMAFGLLGGGIVTYRATCYVQQHFSAGSSAPRLVADFAAMGALLALLPIAFLSFVVGGTLGGGYVSALLGSYGAPFGIALGMFIVLVLGVTCCAAVSALIGRLVARLVYGRAAT